MSAAVNGYIRAEFQIEVPGIYYQFKLRTSDTEPLFVLINENSTAVARLKAGAVITMTYYHEDKTIPPQHIPTLVKYILNSQAAGINNHFMVGLDIRPEIADPKPRLNGPQPIIDTLYQIN